MFHNARFVHRAKLPVSRVGRNVRDVVEAETRRDLEGRCTCHGFVRPDSVKIVDVDSGTLTDVDFGQHFVFTVTVLAEVCKPIPGQRFRGVVRGVNKVGLIAEAGYFDENGTLVPVAETVLINKTVLLENEVPLNALDVGDSVNVEILAGTYELFDNRIQTFGRSVVSLDPPAARAAEAADADTPGASEAHERLELRPPGGAAAEKAAAKRGRGGDAESDAERGGDGDSDAGSYGDGGDAPDSENGSESLEDDAETVAETVADDVTVDDLDDIGVDDLADDLDGLEDGADAVTPE